MSDTTTALVIGGGIAGASAALALDRVGIRPVICEARAEGPQDAGVFLTVATNGIDALRAIDADGAPLEPGFPTPAITLRTATGKRLGEVATGIPLPDGTVSHTIRRADLHRGLRDLVRARGIDIEHDKRLIGASQTGTRVRAEFANGSIAEADVLVGCDGVYSTVRRLIDPAPAPRFAGLLNVGGYATGVRTEASLGTYEMLFGKRAFFGYVTAPDETVWWFGNLPRKAEPTLGALRNAFRREAPPSAARAVQRRCGAGLPPHRRHPRAGRRPCDPHGGWTEGMAPGADRRDRRRCPRSLTQLGAVSLAGHRRRGHPQPAPEPYGGPAHRVHVL